MSMSQQYSRATETQNKPTWIIIMLGLFYTGLTLLLILPPGGTVLDRLRWLDSGICAQMLTHSFYPGGERLPLCARNTGIYLGLMITLISIYARGKGRAQKLPPLSIIIICACGFLALVVDGLNSLALDLHMIHLYQPDNLLRLGTGLLTGAGLVLLALPILNQLFWRGYNEQSIVSSWREFAPLVVALLLCFLIVISQNTFILYPIALLSTAGVLTALSGVNLIFIIACGKRSETLQHSYQLLAFFSIALICAIAEMLLLAQLKFSLFQALGM
jgi:uncharacterized membrane protein